jgi:hypothetical protein
MLQYHQDERGVEGWRVGGSERKKNYIELQLDPALKRSLVFP